MKNSCYAVLLGFSAAAVSGASRAAPCDPAQFLKYEEIKYSNDIALQMIMVDSLSQSARDKIDASGGFVYAGVPVSVSGARDVSNALSKQLRIEFQGSQRTWYTISKLSPTGKDAYLACLKDNKDNFQLELVGDVIGSDRFVILVKSTPKEPLSNRLPVSATATNGRVISSDKTILSTKGATIVVERDPTKETIVIVRVGDDPQTITLPPRPNTIAVEIRDSKPEGHQIWGSRDNIAPTLCINLTNEEQNVAIIPGSFTMHTNIQNANMGGIYLRGQTVNTRSACGKVEWHISSTDGRINGSAWVTVQVAKVVPYARAPAAPSPGTGRPLRDPVQLGARTPRRAGA